MIITVDWNDGTLTIKPEDDEQLSFDEFAAAIFDYTDIDVDSLEEETCGNDCIGLYFHTCHYDLPNDSDGIFLLTSRDWARFNEGKSIRTYF